MNAGVVKSTLKKTDIDMAVKEYTETVLPAIATHEGARSAMLLLNRDTGESLSIALYENEAAAKSFAPKAEKLIASMKQYRSDKTEPKRELFEIVTSTQLEAKAVIERDIKAFNAHDLEALSRDSAPDIEGTAPGDVKLKGPQAVKEYNQNWRTAFPDARIRVNNIVALGNTVVVEGEFSGTHAGTLVTPMGDIRSTGKKVRDEFVQVFTIDRGMVSNVRLYFDRMSLMTQLGLAPTGTQAS